MMTIKLFEINREKAHNLEDEVGAFFIEVESFYHRNREYIFENGDISSKTSELSANYTIYRFFDKTSIKKSYFLKWK